MSLDTNGFDQMITGHTIRLAIQEQHPLIKLANKLPWSALLDFILADLKRTEKKLWWRGRPLRIRIHLGIYLLQQMLNLTDRQAEYALRDNAAFQLFCGVGILEKWHAPDHTKIEAFRSRLTPETQRQLANHLAVHAVKLNYACPTQLDVDSTAQEANISPVSSANLLVKTAQLAKRIAVALTQFNERRQEKPPVYHVQLTQIKAIVLYYFTLKRKKIKATTEVLQTVMQSLWREVASQVMPIIKDSYQLLQVVSLKKYTHLRRAIETLQWRGARLLEQTHAYYFENHASPVPLYALQAYDVMPFNKGKLNKKVEYGRAYQLGRIAGNVVFVGNCTSLNMPDAHSLPAMVSEHERLFGERQLQSIAVDKGYYSHDNQRMLDQQQVEEIYLPKPNRTLNAPEKKPLPPDDRWRLHNRRASIEAMIAHIKHGGQLGRSRMKSDATTLAAGYASVLGFNLRQLKRHLTGAVRPKTEKPIQMIQKTPT